MLALACAHLGDEVEAARIETAAGEHPMSGCGTVLGTPRLLLALLRGDLEAVPALIGAPRLRRTNWFYLSSLAAHLDGLAALGERSRVEAEAAGGGGCCGGVTAGSRLVQTPSPVKVLVMR